MTPIFIGIDYSGAATPMSGLPGLRAYVAERSTGPVEVRPPPGPKKHWTRWGMAEWLLGELSGERPAIVGIDHGFSFPLAYFDRYGLARDWPAFLDDFVRHWPTDQDSMRVEFVREGQFGNGVARSGDRRWRRLTEIRAGVAKSVFFFDVQGSVAKSTHAALPWLRRLRNAVGGRVHFWPFDGWDVPAGRSIVAEVYPSLWSRTYPREGRTGDQHDAYSVAAWLREADADGRLVRFLNPPLGADERSIAAIEGWILGVE